MPTPYHKDICDIIHSLIKAGWAREQIIESLMKDKQLVQEYSLTADQITTAFKDITLMASYS